MTKEQILLKSYRYIFVLGLASCFILQRLIYN